MKAERNALREKAVPALRKYCQERGAHFQAIDLRWGVSAPEYGIRYSSSI